MTTWVHTSSRTSLPQANQIEPTTKAVVAAALRLGDSTLWCILPDWASLSHWLAIIHASGTVSARETKGAGLAALQAATIREHARWAQVTGGHSCAAAVAWFANAIRQRKCFVGAVSVLCPSRACIDLNAVFDVC